MCETEKEHRNYLMHFEKKLRLTKHSEKKIQIKTALFLVFQNNSCIFADSMKKPTTMNSKLNTPNGRCDCLKSPPPINTI